MRTHWWIPAAALVVASALAACGVTASGGTSATSETTLVSSPSAVSSSPEPASPTASPSPTRILPTPAPALKSTLPFPVGVAIDQRETTGVAGDVVTANFTQITPENHMKPEAWYDADHHFRIDPQATALMDFAKAHGLRVYGHCLVWHQQTPSWFFQHDDGTQLTRDPADQAILKDRLVGHITNIAKTLSDAYGPFGSPTNPLVAFDVVNEVVDGGGGFRSTLWFSVLGASYVDIAFQTADEAFNHTYAAPGAKTPVTLFINDYGTEISSHAKAVHDFVADLLARGIPVGGVGHQFHVKQGVAPEALDEALTTFEDLPVVQAVTEFDVPSGTPADEAALDKQADYVSEVFAVFRAHTLFSVTVWGLTDGRSWRASEGAPLLFDDSLAPKPAFYAAAGLW